MAKTLMTNDIYDTKAAGLLYCSAQIQLPPKGITEIIPSDRMF
jgi:hypothetical protein